MVERPSAPCQLRVVITNIINRPERQLSGRVSNVSLVAGGTRWVVAGADEEGRILIYKSLGGVGGNIRFCGPDYRCGAPVNEIQTGQVEDDRFPLVAACCDKDLRCWSVPVSREKDALPSGGEPSLIRGHTGVVRSIDVMKHFVISAAEDGTARLWDLPSQSEVVCMIHPNRVTRAAFMPGSTIVATYCQDNAVRVFDVRISCLRPVHLMQQPQRWAIGGFTMTSEGVLAVGNGMGVSPVSLSGHPASFGEVNLYDIRQSSKQLMHWNLPNSVSSAKFVLRDRYLACACADGYLYFSRMSDQLCTRVKVNKLSPKQKASALGGAPFQSKHMLTYAFADEGWGFAKVYEESYEESVIDSSGKPEMAADSEEVDTSAKSEMAAEPEEAKVEEVEEVEEQISETDQLTS